MKKAKQIDRSWQVGAPWGIKEKTKRNLTLPSYHFQGIVHTDHGYVRIAVYKSPKYTITSLDILMKGKQYRRTFEGKDYSWRFCVTLANRFAHEIENGETI